jgi:hypothetical protein
MDAQRIDGDKLMTALDQHLSEKFGGAKLLQRLVAAQHPSRLRADRQERPETRRSGNRRRPLPAEAERHRRRLHPHAASKAARCKATHIATLMRRAWNREASGDLMVVTKPYWYFGTGNSGTSHGSPYAYDTSVPLLIMGKRWIKPGAYGQYAEVVDIAPTLANLLRVRPPVRRGRPRADGNAALILSLVFSADLCGVPEHPL